MHQRVMISAGDRPHPQMSPEVDMLGVEEMAQSWGLNCLRERSKGPRGLLTFGRPERKLLGEASGPPFPVFPAACFVILPSCLLLDETHGNGRACRRDNRRGDATPAAGATGGTFGNAHNVGVDRRLRCRHLLDENLHKACNSYCCG